MSSQLLPLLSSDSLPRHYAFLCRLVVIVYIVCHIPATFSAITGTYYDQNGNQRQYFTGNATIRTDANIDFRWGGNAPMGSVGRDDFSVRWVGELEIPTSGDYTFSTRSDDGVRLYINGNLIIDNWTDHGPTIDYGFLGGLTGGQRYPITMEYYERAGGTVAELYWQGPGISRQIIPASQLYTDASPPTIQSVSSPCYSGELVVNFSEPVTQASAENLANYSADSGIVFTSASLNLSGNELTLTYFGGAGTSFNLTANNISDTSGNVMSSPQSISVPTTNNGLSGTYFDQNGNAGQFFTGNQTVRIDSTVDFSWGNNAPLSGVNDDNFSVRWEGEIEAPSSGSYTFYTVSDDGVRLYLDGNLIINNWTDHSSTTNASLSQTLTAGQRYAVTMEFYERGGQAEARLEWSGPSISRQAIPSAQLFATCPSPFPSRIAHWQLDDSNWNGSAGEVTDDSGNNLNGRAINLNGYPTTSSANPALTGDPGTCGYGEFAGAADGYLQIDDPGASSLLDLSSEYSVSAWVYPTSYPASDLATIVSKDENFEFHLSSTGQINWWWGGGSRELTTTASIPLNTWTHITITNTTGQQAIYINGSTSATNTSTSAITVNNDPVLIGMDLGYPSRRFSGRIDQVAIFDAALTALQVNDVVSERHTCPVSAIHHYEINHSGLGVTCEAENITISAHDIDDNTQVAAGETIRLTATSNTAGWNANVTAWTLISGSGALATPSDGVAEYTFAAGESAVTLALANTIAADIDIDIVDTNNSSVTDLEGTTEDPLLTFRDTAFRFYNDANNDGDSDGTDPVPTPLVAGQTSNTIILRAIETNTVTGACEGRLVGSQDVELAYECVNPTSCIRDQDLSLTGSSIQENNLNNITDYTTMTLTFDADGEAPLTVQYFDAGNIRLHARKTLTASSPDPAIQLIGASDTMTVKPADLVITQVQSASNVSNPGTTNSGTGFTTAGSTFQVTVQARNTAGGLTPNFGQEQTPEGIELTAESLIMPSGGNFPALNSASSFSAGSQLGEWINTAVNWPEVGTITMRASIDDGDYLTAGDVIGTQSGNIGRFYPARFNLLTHSLSPECISGNFSYMSDISLTHRPFDVSYSIRAEGDGVTNLLNYDTVLGYPVDSFIDIAENDNSGNDLSARAGIPTTTWQNGLWNISGSNNGGFTRLLVGANITPDGPYSNLQFGLKTVGSGPDAVDFETTALNMNSALNNDCVNDGNCDAIMIGSAQRVWFGRLYGQNAHGPESTALPVELTTQYWNGTQFVKNTADDCTQINASDIAFSGSTIDSDANRTVPIGSATTTGSFTSLTPGVNIQFNEGDAGLTFSAPGEGNTGTFSVDIDLTNYPWLRHDWDQNSDYNNDTSLPSISISFGRYRGHDRVIHWNEVFD